jgi:hypothetical protein
MLKRAINVMHGHQVNLPTIQLILDIISQNKNRNASFAYDKFQDARMHNDPTLVSVTKPSTPATAARWWPTTLRTGRRQQAHLRLWPQPYMANPRPSLVYRQPDFIQITGTAWAS